MQIDVSFLPAFAAAFMLSFARIGTIVMLLPGLGEMTVSPRVRLTIAWCSPLSSCRCIATLSDRPPRWPGAALARSF
jgi:flagellar biosynthesis protein FliR